jgi:dTDP-4-amino-4,6-dideoxygalactose transaminase
MDFSGDGEAEVSIYILQDAAGQGIGSMALRQACAWFFERYSAGRLWARISRSNNASIAFFTKQGFVPQLGEQSKDGCYVFLLKGVPHNRLTFGEVESLALQEVARSGQWNSARCTQRIERELADLSSRKFGVAVGSGVGALRLAILGLGVKPGDRVIIPAYSCVALANAVLAVDGIPVAADIEHGTWNLDPGSVRRRLNEHPASLIIAVHTFGRPADIHALKVLGLPVLEDCSHAFGIKNSGSSIGSQADATIISLHATKLIGGGEGGCVLTDQETCATFVRGNRDYGDQAPSRYRLNDKITECSAAIAMCQVERLPEMLRKRAALAARYHEHLAALHPYFTLPARGPHAWYRYVIECHAMSAREVCASLLPCGVTVAEPVHDWRDEESRSRTPNATLAYRSLFSLPLYPTLTFSEQDRVIQTLASLFSS